MSDENDNRDDESSPEESQGPLGGERLAQARRELQLTVLDIAKELHLDEYKIHALERNDFDVLGAPVFAKGHLRKFAQLVKVSEADVMADYYQLSRSADAPPVLSPRPRPRQVISPGPYVVGIIIVLVAALAYWWFGAREDAPQQPVTGEIASLPQQTLSAQGANEFLNATADAVDEEEQPVISEPEAAVETADTPIASGMRLSITYSGDCWTEITDAMGRRLFFDLGRSGRTVNLFGEPPFNVLFGNAGNVSLVVNGTPFDISAADRRGRTARLTITGS